MADQLQKARFEIDCYWYEQIKKQCPNWHINGGENSVPFDPKRYMNGCLQLERDYQLKPPKPDTTKSARWVPVDTGTSISYAGSKILSCWWMVVIWATGIAMAVGLIAKIAK